MKVYEWYRYCFIVHCFTNVDHYFDYEVLDITLNTFRFSSIFLHTKLLHSFEVMLVVIGYVVLVYLFLVWFPHCSSTDSYWICIDSSCHIFLYVFMLTLHIIEIPPITTLISHRELHAKIIVHKFTYLNKS